MNSDRKIKEADEVRIAASATNSTPAKSSNPSATERTWVRHVRTNDAVPTEPKPHTIRHTSSSVANESRESSMERRALSVATNESRKSTRNTSSAAERASAKVDPSKSRTSSTEDRIVWSPTNVMSSYINKMASNDTRDIDVALVVDPAEPSNEPNVADSSVAKSRGNISPKRKSHTPRSTGSSSRRNIEPKEVPSTAYWSTRRTPKAKIPTV